MKKTILLVAGSVVWWALNGQAAALSYVDLVNRLTDLKQLSVLPLPGEQCAQWSSYDRKSRYEEATGKYLLWDANGDGDGIIRKEGDTLVLAEMQGPGCIWRIWSADAKQGHVKIYLDGAAEPAVDLPFVGYFDLKNEPFTRPALVHTVSRGWNNYTPIPYRKSCKVIAEKGWGLYYQFVYSTFPKGTEVPTFKSQLSAQESAALDAANRLLTRCDTEAVTKLPGQKTIAKALKIGAGKSASVARLEGPRAINSLKVKLNPGATAADLDLLRELVIQIKWDGEDQPSVWSPLGDFFGTAPGANSYRSLPLGLTADGWWYCNWYMPFAKVAQIELVNEGKIARNLEFAITHAPLPAPDQTLGRFHAKWHRDAFLPAEPERRAIDWTILQTQGTGRFLGVCLHIWNPRGSWWGEGDEKFFVDGEKFPSTIGTGSEDYFGYAWCDPGLFQNAYHNQTRNDGNNRGHVSVNRWHIGDNVPFQKSFSGYIEKYYPNTRPTLYAATTYWYLKAGGVDPYRPVPLNERIGYWSPIETFKIKGVIEGERLKILSRTAGNPHEQDLTGFGEGRWSNEAHLWWIEAKPGDKLVLAVPVPKAGNYQISMQMTKAVDYGIVQLYLDGEKLGEPIDLFNSSVIPTGAVGFGARQLPAGEHKLAVEILGANEKAVRAYMFGLDYVKLEPTP